MESYNNILSRMQTSFKNLAGFDPDDASDIGIRLKVLAGEIFSLYSEFNYIKNQIFIQTSTGENLDNQDETTEKNEDELNKNENKKGDDE